MITLALQSCLRPRIGRSRAFSLPWSHSMRLLPILLDAVPGGWKQLLEHRRVHRRLIGGYLAGCDLGGANRPLEEPAGCPHVPPGSDEHVNNLPELVDRSIHVAPLSGNLHVGFVHLPAVADSMSAGPSGVDQQRREALHPPIDG